MQDRFIAKGTHLLAVDFKNPGREIVVPLQVLDSKDKPAGVLEFSVQYVPAPDSLKVILSAIPQRMGEDVAASRIQNLFRKKSTIRASVPGKVETLVAATATSKLTIQPIRGLKLKKVQKLGTQDPYVRATVIPANKTQRTLCVNNGGRNPEWDQSDHNSALSFDLMPQPDDAHILVEVFDAEALTKDRLIGSAQYPLKSITETSVTTTLEIFDKNQQSAGYLVCDVWRGTKTPSTAIGGAAVLTTTEPRLYTGGLRVRAVKAFDLPAHFVDAELHTRVRVTIIPSQETPMTKSVANGGKNPVWVEARTDQHALCFGCRYLKCSSQSRRKAFILVEVLHDNTVLGKAIHNIDYDLSCSGLENC